MLLRSRLGMVLASAIPQLNSGGIDADCYRCDFFCCVGCAHIGYFDEVKIKKKLYSLL